MRLRGQQLSWAFLVSHTIVKSKSIRGKGVRMCPYFPFCILTIVSLFNNSSINDSPCSQEQSACTGLDLLVLFHKIRISKHTYMGRHLDYSISL